MDDSARAKLSNVFSTGWLIVMFLALIVIVAVLIVNIIYTLRAYKYPEVTVPENKFALALLILSIFALVMTVIFVAYYANLLAVLKGGYKKLIQGLNPKLLPALVNKKGISPAVPTDAALTSSTVTPNAAAGSAPAGYVPAGSAPAGYVPSGSASSGYVPAGSASSGYVPAGSAPAGYVPAGSAPAGYVPAKGVPYTTVHALSRPLNAPVYVQTTGVPNAMPVAPVVSAPAMMTNAPQQQALIAPVPSSYAPQSGIMTAPPPPTQMLFANTTAMPPPGGQWMQCYPVQVSSQPTGATVFNVVPQGSQETLFGYGPAAGYGSTTVAGYGPTTVAGYGPTTVAGYGSTTAAGYGSTTAAGYGSTTAGTNAGRNVFGTYAPNLTTTTGYAPSTTTTSGYQVGNTNAQQYAPPQGSMNQIKAQPLYQNTTNTANAINRL